MPRVALALLLVLSSGVVVGSPSLMPDLKPLPQGRCGGPAPSASRGPDRALRVRPTSSDFLRRADAGAYFFMRASSGNPPVARFHAGVDLVPRASFTTRNDYRVVASGNGAVAFVGNATGYGNTIVIDHGNGEYSLSAHLAPDASRDCVRVGEQVVAGQVIGFIFDPSTGEKASGNASAPTGVHVLDRDQLHFEWLVGLKPGQRAKPGDKVSIFWKDANRSELRNPSQRLIELGYGCSEAEARCTVTLPQNPKAFDP